MRGPVVFYNRSNEAAALLKPGDFDWKGIFAGGVRWFHSGGIFAALGPTTADVIIEGMTAAKAAGAVISFDLNFREKLWKASGGGDRAVEVVRRFVDHVDVLVGNEEDLQKGLGIAGPEVAAKSKLDPSAFFGMIERVVAQHPRVRVVATTLRDVHSTTRHSWGAVAWLGGTNVAPTAELDVYDRVGGGDGFASGLFYGLLTGEPPEVALKLGWAHGALLTSFPGDTTMATVEQVRALAAGGSARIQRLPMRAFLDENSLLDTDVAADLYHRFASDLPIIDYHCHLPPGQMASDHRFRSVTELWLDGDHSYRTRPNPQEASDATPATVRRGRALPGGGIGLALAHRPLR